MYIKLQVPFTVHLFEHSMDVNNFPNSPWFRQRSTKSLKSFENIDGKGRLASNQHYLSSFPTMFTIF